MKKLLTAAAVALVSMTCTGMALADASTYFKNRGNDFLDIFRARAGFPEHGRGYGAKLRVTSLAQVGYVDFDGSYAGLERRGVGVVDEKRREAGVSVLYGSYNEMVPTAGNQYLRASTNWSLLEDRRIIRNLPHWDDGRRRPLSIGGELALPIGAIDLGIYPEEVADFVVGIVTLDMFNDDAEQDVDIPNQLATTAAKPKDDAPFADRRAKNEALKAALAAKMLEEAGQSGETAESPVAPAVDAGGARTQVVPAEPPPPTDKEKADAITAEQADRTMKALEGIEGAKEMLERTAQPNIVEDGEKVR
ncbi:hypothetical protein GC173_19100 [bacterium]|nr:hypothetical protein [bacterium]